MMGLFCSTPILIVMGTYGRFECTAWDSEEA